MMLHKQQRQQQRQHQLPLRIAIALKTVGTEGMLQFSNRILHSDHSQCFCNSPYMRTAHVALNPHRACSPLNWSIGRLAGRPAHPNYWQSKWSTATKRSNFVIIYAALVSFAKKQLNLLTTAEVTATTIALTPTIKIWCKQLCKSRTKNATGFQGHSIFSTNITIECYAPSGCIKWRVRDTCQPTRRFGLIDLNT